jgi:hypothetical protein
LKRFVIPSILIVSLVIVLFILSRILFFYSYRTAVVRVGDSPGKIDAVFGPGRYLRAPDAVIFRSGRLIVKDEDGSAIKQYKADGSFMSAYFLSNGQMPLSADTIGIDRSGRLYAEVVSEAPEVTGTNMPEGSSSLYRFDPSGKLMKTVAFFDGRLTGIRFNNYNYMTVIIRDNQGRYHIQRYADDIAVLNAVFSNESPVAETGIKHQLAAVLTAVNDGQAVLEFRCYDGKKGGYLYTRLMSYDLLQQKFLPDLFVLNDESAELLASDTDDRLYFTSMAAKGLLRLTLRNLHGRLIKSKLWDVSFRNRFGFLLFPFITPEGLICQARVDTRFFRVVSYR